MSLHIDSVTAIPDQFCDFESGECGWRSDGFTWAWTRQKISDITVAGPNEDHRGNNQSELIQFKIDYYPS